MNSAYLISAFLYGLSLLSNSYTTSALPQTNNGGFPPSDTLNPYPTHKRLIFRPDGTLHLTIFSDLHFGENPWDSWGPQQDVNSLALMREVLKDKPDYVVLNGDLITGESE